MNCSICRDLEQALESRKREYVAACSSPYSRVSSRFVAYDIVEMERARSALDMHRSVCIFADADGRLLASKHETVNLKFSPMLVEASRI